MPLRADSRVEDVRRARCYVCVLKLGRGIILVIGVMNRDRSMSNKSGDRGLLCSTLGEPDYDDEDDAPT